MKHFFFSSNGYGKIPQTKGKPHTDWEQMFLSVQPIIFLDTNLQKLQKTEPHTPGLVI